jgi:ABC-type dipeptide/oligopeptide/nickel transport system permease component
MTRVTGDNVFKAIAAVIAASAVVILVIAVAVVIFQIITDIVYAWLDPRIRFD